MNIYILYKLIAEACIGRRYCLYESWLTFQKSECATTDVRCHTFLGSMWGPWRFGHTLVRYALLWPNRHTYDVPWRFCHALVLPSVAKSSRPSQGPQKGMESEIGGHTFWFVIRWSTFIQTIASPNASFGDQYCMANYQCQMHLYVYVYINLYIYMYIYMWMYVYIYIYVCVYIYTYIYIYIFIYKYIYVYIWLNVKAKVAL